MDQNRRRRIHFMDRAAKWLITLGGLAVILCMAVMILLMVRVAWPLFGNARVEKVTQIDLQASDIVAFSLDDYQENAYRLDRQGRLVFIKLQTQEARSSKVLRQNAEIVYADADPQNLITLTWSDGITSLEQIEFKSVFDEVGNRRIEPQHETLAMFSGQGVMRNLMRATDSGRVVVEQIEDQLLITSETEEEDLFGEVERVTSASSVLLPGLTDFSLSRDGRDLYAGSGNGELVVWRIEADSEPSERTRINTGSPIHKMTLLFGDESLVVASDTRLSTWFFASNQFVEVHRFEKDWNGARQLVPSFRDKSVFVLRQDGTVSQFHTTTEQEAVRLRGDHELKQIMVNHQGQVVIGQDVSNKFWTWEIYGPHIEISAGILWTKVWYEGYLEPTFAWQSSASTDDFEPKLSLVPLVRGSLKGTLYSLIFALPIALLGAMYTSYLMDPRWKRFIKPAVELMAAIPSVVVGFLAALWLAPILENRLPATFLSLIVVPATVIVGMILWRYAFGKSKPGREFVRILPLLCLAILFSVLAGDAIQEWLFAGDFELWYFQAYSQAVDQRNCVVIAFALGFAVIPIIFTMSEDALSNVPAHVTAASLALGATPWQTLRKVVLPMASPGIFAAAMIGFGRAVGETMIVLMATGNTPVLDWSIFNGMRTLSANIAVEIPEAPIDGSLYRVLFLTALILFALTFLVNTAAEFVRHSLRKRYGQF